MLSLKGVLLSLLLIGMSILCSSANVRNKRWTDEDDFYPHFWPWYYPPSGAHAGRGGAYASAGVGPWGFLHPFWYPMPFIPDFERIKPWYEGEHVCNKTVDIDDPKFKELIKDMPKNSECFSSRAKHESCTGENGYRLCKGWLVKNGQVREYATLQFCCPGCVFTYNPPRCAVDDGKSTPEHPGRVVYAQDSSSSSSSYNYYKHHGKGDE